MQKKEKVEESVAATLEEKYKEAQVCQYTTMYCACGVGIIRILKDFISVFHFFIYFLFFIFLFISFARE